MMPTDLEIEDWPDEVIAQLQLRAALHRRSLEEEVLTILEAAVATMQRSAADKDA
jgi:plasmid stability protein